MPFNFAIQQPFTMTQSVYSTQPTPQPPPTRYYVRMAKPVLTRLLIGVNVVVFIAMLVVGFFLLDRQGGSALEQITNYISSIISLLMGNKFPETDLSLLMMGAKYNQLIFEGQVWRLFTAMFLHIGIIHLLFNLFALNALGPMVEGYFGHWRFALIYLIGGLFGSLASYAFSAAPSAGASGAVFGLAGATTIYFLTYRDNFGTRGESILQSMLAIIGINLVFGFAMSGIDNWGHIGGLIGGAIVAWGLLPKYEQPTLGISSEIVSGPQALPQKQNNAWELAWSGLMLASVWVALQLANTVTPI